MPKKCCVPNCKVQKDDSDGLDLSFYVIPANVDLRKKWLQHLKQHFDVEFNKKYSYVCSQHFKSDCFESTSITLNRRLKKGSCPTIFSSFKTLDLPNMKEGLAVIDERSSNNSSPANNSTHLNKNIVANHEKIECALQDEETSMSVVSDEDGSSFQFDLSEQERNCDRQSMTDSENVIINQCCNNSSFTSTCNYSNNSTASDHDTIGDSIHDEKMVSVILNQEGLNSSIEHNKQKKNHNSINSDSSKLNNIFKKSLANIDIDSIEFTAENLLILKRLLYNGRNEIISLRRKMKSRRMKVYRYKKRVNDVKSLSSHMKNNKYLTDNVSKLREVSIDGFQLENHL